MRLLLKKIATTTKEKTTKKTIKAIEKIIKSTQIVYYIANNANIDTRKNLRVIISISIAINATKKNIFKEITMFTQRQTTTTTTNNLKKYSIVLLTSFASQ